MSSTSTPRLGSLENCATTESLNEYELQRLEHMRRNHEELVRLGLADPEPDPSEAPNPKAKRPMTVPDDSRRCISPAYFSHVAARVTAGLRTIGRPWHEGVGAAAKFRGGDQVQGKKLRSISLGWSTFPGGSEMQLAAFNDDEAYELKATKSEEGKRLLELARPIVMSAWAEVVTRYPEESRRMLSKISPKRPSLFGTGWSRLNLAVDCPTIVHCDANIGVTAVFAADVSPPSVTREGGDHVQISTTDDDYDDGGDERREAVVIRDGRYGVLLFSKAFDNVSHCNLATANFEACLGAGRLSITPYLPADRVIGNLKQDQAPGVGRELSRI
jgi:hypothetical protein